MGLVARAIERNGIPTISVSISETASRLALPPRTVYVRWPFGHAFGEPGNEAQHHTVLADALDLLEHATEPGTLKKLPYRWRRHHYVDPLAV